MFRDLNLLLLLLLFCLFNNSGTPPVGSDLKPVTGKKGGNITLQCELENNEIIYLIRRSESIFDCQNKKCGNKTENVQGICKEGACDIIIKNLSFRDAGKYILRINNYPTEKEQQIRMYQLHIQDEISVKIGEELRLDVLMTSADKVEHQNKTSKEWTEIWSRSDRVQSERLTDTDGNLSINNFTASDAGSYRVLDPEGNILITVIVTESAVNLNNADKDKLLQHEHWILPVGVCSGILALAVIVIPLIIWQCHIPES